VAFIYGDEYYGVIMFGFIFDELFNCVSILSELSYLEVKYGIIGTLVC
jgi:hypothetical protein